jgi:drug/metabolite transporter (DMT)-like permease
VLISLVAAIGATVAFGVASILQAIGARQEPVGSALDPRLLFRLLRRPAFVWSMVLSLAGFGMHLVALRALPLFVVQPVIAASVAVTAVVSGRLAHEPLSARTRLLVAVLCLGLVLVTAAAVSGSAEQTSTAQRSLLLLVVLAMAAAATPAGRVSGPRGATTLGLLAGVGYAVVAVAGRSIPELAVPAVLADPAAYALVAGGGLAILLYSVSLQRGTVVSATAAMVLGNTVVPMLIGLAVLGDRFRSGWAPAAVVGLALAAGSVILLHDPRSAPAPTSSPAPGPAAASPDQR